MAKVKRGKKKKSEKSGGVEKKLAKELKVAQGKLAKIKKIA
jgi:hypothetical protein